MKKRVLPFLSAAAFRQKAHSLRVHLNPSIKTVATSPGTLTYTGHETAPTKINLFQYDKHNLSAEPIDSVGELKEKLSAAHTNWVDVTGFENIELIRELGTAFGIDQLTLEDLLNVSQLPKIEEHEEYLYITLKLVDLVAEEHTLDFTHYSLILTDEALITFSEKPSKLLTHIEDRLKNNVSKLRNSNMTYLSYRIIDTIVDYYYYTLEWFTNLLADLEVEMVENPSKKHINTILTFKKQWLILRKAFYPFKDAVRRMMNLEPRFIKPTMKHYITDLHDHLQSIGETMEILRETLENLMDLYSSSVGNKLNEVMKVLTIVSTIFIPLTFIAGIYGMNFEHMPELSWENGYFYALGAMVCVGIGMSIYMKRKRWF